MDYLHTVRVIESSPRRLSHRIGVRLKQLARHPWIAAASWHVVRLAVPSRWSVNLVDELEANGTDLFLLYGDDEIWPLPGVPFFRSVDVQRLRDTDHRHVELVPGLDHGMHFAEGRSRTVELLDRHVLEHYAGVDRGAERAEIPNDWQFPK